MAPRASIIILCKNAAQKIDSVLKGIFAGRTDFAYEVIIIDSGSRDGTKDIIAKYPVKVIEIPPNLFSHGGTRNTGASLAGGEFIVFLTQDAVPKDEYWLSRLLDNFSDSGVAGVYGRQLPEDDSPPMEKFFLSYVYPDKK